MPGRNCCCYWSRITVISYIYIIYKCYIWWRINELKFYFTFVSSIRKAGINFENMFEEVQVVVKNSHLVNGLCCELEEVAPSDNKYQFLDLATGYVETQWYSLYGNVGLSSSLQNKIWNLQDWSTILPKFIYDKEGKLAGLTQILLGRVRGPALVLKTDQAIIFCDAQAYIDGLVQERRNSIANTLELRLSCTKPLIWKVSLWRLCTWIMQYLLLAYKNHISFLLALCGCFDIKDPILPV